MWVSGVLAILLSALYVLVPLEITPIPLPWEWEQNLTPVPLPDEHSDLTKIRLLAKGGLHEPETVTFDSAGNLFAFVGNEVVQVLPDESVTTWAHTGGRPISGQFDANGDLIVADTMIGLLKINKETREITLLSTQSDDGEPLRFSDDVDIAADGKIYFSDASAIAPKRDRNGILHLVDASLYTLFEGKPTGRLLVYDPATKKTTVLIRDLLFANGVCVSHDNSFVLINETFRKKVHRYWLTGEKKGTHDVFSETLPGFVDGVSPASNGNYYVTMPSLDQEKALGVIMRFPGFRGFLSKFFVPHFSKVTPKIGAVVELDPNGQIVRFLSDPKGEVIHSITSVTEHKGKLYLGSFHDFIGVKDLTN